MSLQWCKILFLKEFSYFQDASAFSRGVIYGLFKILQYSFQNLKQHLDRQIKWRIHSPSEIISTHCGGMLSAKKYSNLTTSWRFEKNENGNFSAFQHLSWVVMCCLCTLQTTVLRIVNFLSKYDKFCTAEKQLKTILSRNGLVIRVFQFYSFLSKK